MITWTSYFIHYNCISYNYRCMNTYKCISHTIIPLLGNMHAGPVDIWEHIRPRFLNGVQVETIGTEFAFSWIEQLSEGYWRPGLRRRNGRFQEELSSPQKSGNFLEKVKNSLCECARILWLRKPRSSWMDGYTVGDPWETTKRLSLGLRRWLASCLFFHWCFVNSRDIFNFYYL